LRLAVGGAFVAAGVLKIADPAKFALDVDNYRLAPHAMINLIAILIPWIEVTAGSFVLAGIWLRAAALVITSLTVMFFFVIVSALARGLNIECGCFGTVGGKHIGLVNLAIDALCFHPRGVAGRTIPVGHGENTPWCQPARRLKLRL
jgi:putative oxidoreductase